jgi:hypothetical protein
MSEPEEKFYKVFHETRLGNLTGPWHRCPKKWVVKSGRVLEAKLNTDMERRCAEGVHFANKGWLRTFVGEVNAFFSRGYLKRVVLFEVKPAAGARVVEPIDSPPAGFVFITPRTDKKFRTDRLRLVRKLSKKETDILLGR